MSEYRDFDRCIICRTQKNLQSYHGDFEVTMLLNSLYVALMFPFENRKKLGLKSKQIVKYLNEHNLLNQHDNEFDSDSIVRYLRNSLAHYNIQIIPENEMIAKVKLWGINAPKKTICNNSCNSPKCVPTQYKSNDDGEICTFEFTVDELSDLTLFVLKKVLSQLPSDVCDRCI